MENPHQFEKIERYLRRQMNKEELDAFESELKTDTQLADQLKHQRLENLAINAYREEQLKNEFILKGRESLKRMEAGKPPFRQLQPIRMAWRVAAGILVLVVALPTFATLRYSDTALAKRYYEAPKEIIPAGSIPAGYTAFYSEKNYQKTIDIFSQIPPEDPAYPEAQFFIGHSQFELGNYAEAYAVFDSLIQKNTIPGKTNLKQLKWDRLVSQLMLDGGEQAVLEVLNSNDSSFPEGVALKKDLKSFWRKLSFN